MAPLTESNSSSLNSLYVHFILERSEDVACSYKGGIGCLSFLCETSFSILMEIAISIKFVEY